MIKVLFIILQSFSFLIYLMIISPNTVITARYIHRTCSTCYFHTISNWNMNRFPWVTVERPTAEIIFARFQVHELWGQSQFLQQNRINQHFIRTKVLIRELTDSGYYTQTLSNLSSVLFYSNKTYISTVDNRLVKVWAQWGLSNL